MSKKSVCRNISTNTDLSTDGCSEVELVSLIEEQIPRYVLRADTLTDFGGYDNSDWIQTPCLPPDEDLDLSPEIVSETFKYFILCAERVGSMTKTYNDIEAVTRLLEEKERDLELAARIGQTLLDKNRDIVSRNEELEDSLVESNDRVSQLSHELSMKSALLTAYAQDIDEHEDDSPFRNEDTGWNASAHLDCLTRKVKVLQEENESLRIETSTLSDDTTELEEREDALLRGVLEQITDANGKLHALQNELMDKTEVTVRQQDEITALVEKIFSLEGQVKKMAIENTELHQHLAEAVKAQRGLTSEISELNDKYHEAISLLHDTQDDLALAQSQQKPTVARPHYACYNPFLPEGSLAAELDQSIKKDMDYPAGYSPNERKSHSRRVMETARCVRKQAQKGDSPDLGNLPASNFSSFISEGEYCESEVDSSYGSAMTLSMESGIFGRSSIPGSNDLETALRRLSMRKANEINETILQEQDGKLNRNSFSLDCPTPDSVLSGGSRLSGGSGSGSHTGSHTGSHMSDLSRLSFRIPEKLQIVKPMEGSLTLHQWSRLATPHLTSFLTPAPGVQSQGHVDLDTEDIYHMSDIEEDEPADMSSVVGASAIASSNKESPDSTKTLSRWASFTSLRELAGTGGLRRSSCSSGLSLFSEDNMKEHNKEVGHNGPYEHLKNSLVRVREWQGAVNKSQSRIGSLLPNVEDNSSGHKSLTRKHSPVLFKGFNNDPCIVM